MTETHEITTEETNLMNAAVVVCEHVEECMSALYGQDRETLKLALRAGIPNAVARYRDLMEVALSTIQTAHPTTGSAAIAVLCRSVVADLEARAARLQQRAA